MPLTGGVQLTGAGYSRDGTYTGRMEQYWMAPHLDILHLIHLGCVSGVTFNREKVVMNSFYAGTLVGHYPVYHITHRTGFRVTLSCAALHMQTSTHTMQVHPPQTLYISFPQLARLFHLCLCLYKA